MLVRKWQEVQAVLYQENAMTLIDPANHIGLSSAARAAQIRHRNEGIRVRQITHGRRVELTRGDECREFRNAQDAAKRMRMNLGSLYAALSKGITVGGWKARYL